MSKYLARLNPAERRLVVGAALLVFLVLNLVYVWPHFSDLGQLKTRLGDAQAKFGSYENTIQQSGRLEPDMAKLKQEGGEVPPEDQSISFLKTVQLQANQSGVGFLRNSSPRTGSNQFFLDQTQTISVQGGEKQLVDFLYNLGAGNSMIRVRSLAVHPDASRQLLGADITLIASYQKSKTSGAARAAAPVKPVATTVAAPAKPELTPRPPLPAPLAPPSPPVKRHAITNAPPPRKK